MRDAFLKQLEELHKMLAEMGNLCESMIDGAYEALMNMDREQAAKILAADANVDLKERDIESKCLKLLLEQQPVASDLRTISSTLKMITDLERIGDQAEDIVDLIPKMAKGADEIDPRIRQMAASARYMVTEAVNAYVRQDLELARTVMNYDDVIDDYFNQVKGDILTMLAERKADGEYALDLLMIDKYFERIGDHCTNIAEWVEFSVTGTHRSCQ